MQKAIKGRLSTTGAAYARFFYAWPFALMYVWALSFFGGYDLPPPNLIFFIYCALGGLSQILFTVVLLWMFSFRSFAVGTTFSKLEVVLIAALGAVLLGDTVGPLAILAIAVGAMGTILLSLTETKLTFGGLWRGLGEKATLVGLLCAGLAGRICRVLPRRCLGAGWARLRDGRCLRIGRRPADADNHDGRLVCGFRPVPS